MRMRVEGHHPNLRVMFVGIGGGMATSLRALRFYSFRDPDLPSRRSTGQVGRRDKARESADGWQHIRTTGSHLHFKHSTKPGLVTMPADEKLPHDIAPGTLRSILRPA